MLSDQRPAPTQAPSPAQDGQVHEGPRLSLSRILRLGAMVEALLIESSEITLDPAGRELLADIYQRSVAVIADALPSDLARELGRLLPELSGAAPSQGELRIAQAQLHGWLTGLLQGLHVVSASQHLEAHRQLAARQAADREHERERDREERAGRHAAYL
jgi:hypothetical protein